MGSMVASDTLATTAGAATMDAPTTPPLDKAMIAANITNWNKRTRTNLFPSTFRYVTVFLGGNNWKNEKLVQNDE